MPEKKYPDLKKISQYITDIDFYSRLKFEYGSTGIHQEVEQLESVVREALDNIASLPVDEELKKQEPDGLVEIRKLRPAGPRRLWQELPADKYAAKMTGAITGRFAGCTLGSPVEGWEVARMQEWADKFKEEFPPADYWSHVSSPHNTRYIVSQGSDFLRHQLDGVPADDDVIYPLLGLMILEKHGFDFTTSDVGDMWDEYLPWMWIDMERPMASYKAGAKAEEAAEDSPLCQLICAFIRCDAYAYAAPGWPEKAAELAYRDALMSHRRNGIYGSMFFAAAISAAFAVEDPIEAVKIGLTEIPENCRLAQEIRWTLGQCGKIGSYLDARRLIDTRFNGMHKVHTINNACLTVMGLSLGGRDFTRTISQTVAMGMDNDCTAATAGSVAGAALGISGIPKFWYKNFNNKVHSYIKDHEWFRIDDVVVRYTKLAEAVHQMK